MKNKILDTIKTYWKDPYVRFIVLLPTLSLIFYGFNIAFIGITAEGGYYVPFLDKYFNYIRWWRTALLESTAVVLRWFGYIVYTGEYQMRIIGKYGISMVYSCLGYGIVGVFVAFGLTFPGKIKARPAFLITGVLFIQLLNMFRVALLSLYWDPLKPVVAIDHHDLFNLVVYALLMLFTICWLKCQKTS